VPLISFFGLMHFRISFALFVFSGAGRRNNGGVDNAAFTQHQAVFLQVFVHLFEQHLAKAVALQEMAEFENRGFVPQPVQFQACELTHEFDLVQGIFHGRVAEVIEQLHAVNAQHRGQRVRWSTSLALGVITGYLLLQLLPENQFLHSFQKDLAAGFALLGLALGFREGDLIHGGTESYAVDDGRIIANFET
jgi:hypothetical protein